MKIFEIIPNNPELDPITIQGNTLRIEGSVVRILATGNDTKAIVPLIEILAIRDISERPTTSGTTA